MRRDAQRLLHGGRALHVHRARRDMDGDIRSADSGQHERNHSAVSIRYCRKNPPKPSLISVIHNQWRWSRWHFPRET